MKINFTDIDNKAREMFDVLEPTQQQIYKAFCLRNPDIRISFMEFSLLYIDYVKSFSHN